MERISQHIEALIFSSSSPIRLKELTLTLEKYLEVKIKEEDMIKSIEELQEKYRDESFAFELVEIGNAYQFLTKGAYFEVISTYLRLSAKKRLSRAALETLAIIAYKQPTTKAELEHIRGVSCDYSIQKLLEKELVEISGRAEGPGRPLLYVTSQKFMDYFGMKSLKDLPRLKEFETEENTIGSEPEIEEPVNQ